MGDSATPAPDQALSGDEPVGEHVRTTQEPAPPTKADQRRLADLTAGNAAAEQALAAQGIRLNQQAIVALQARALIRLVVGDDPARQLAYDIAYQQSVAEGLAEVAADAARKKLAAGNGHGLVLPGR